MNIGEQMKMQELEDENKVLKRSLVAVSVVALALLACGFVIGIGVVL